MYIPLAHMEERQKGLCTVIVSVSHMDVSDQCCINTCLWGSSGEVLLNVIII